MRSPSTKSAAEHFTFTTPARASLDAEQPHRDDVSEDIIEVHQVCRRQDTALRLACYPCLGCSVSITRSPSQAFISLVVYRQLR